MAWYDPLTNVHKKVTALNALKNMNDALKKADPYAFDYPKGYVKYEKDKRICDLNYKILRNLRCRLSSYINSKKTNLTKVLLGCSIIFLIEYLESQFKEGMSWENYGVKGWHIDHIKPCASFD